MVEEEKIRNFDYEISTPEMRELKQVQWLRVAGDEVVLKGDKEFAINGKLKGQCSRGDKCSSRHDSGERAKSTLKTNPSCDPQTQRGRSASRKGTLRGRSPSGKIDRQPCKDFLKGICTNFL